jgi:GntR family transcriptional regulator, carbon starvation induced regulator
VLGLTFAAVLPVFHSQWGIRLNEKGLERSAARAGAFTTQTSMAIERLRAEIISGHLKPNEKLRVKPLMQRYGFSSSALREALSRLVTDGLVEAVDQRGFRTTPASREQLIDITETRVTVESVALQRSIEHGDLAWESRIVAAFHRLARSPGNLADIPVNERGALWVAHDEFHAALISACRSEWLLYFCKLMYQHAERYRFLWQVAVTEQNQQRNALQEHEDLMKATLERDAPKACSLLGEHFWRTTTLILETAGLLDSGGALMKATGTPSIRPF